MSDRGREIPLAERMRPTDIADFAGQKHLLGPDKILWRLLKGDYLPSMLLWGPPGIGKTTLARILARLTGAHFVFFSAVLSGIKDVRLIVDESRLRRERNERPTILFVDEIHRFNKAQQDGFLPHVESGLLTLIGATTENPSFHVIAPLLSRCQVLVLEGLDETSMAKIIERALNDTENGLGRQNLQISSEAAKHLIMMADGDARSALNNLEVAAALCASGSGETKLINLEIAEEACQRRSLRYDKKGEEHYNLISALHKSLRDSDPDGSLYWLVRMLTAGEDPLYVARRLIRFASEDIGNADPAALGLAVNARETYHILGSPEGELALAQLTVYLATAPKSNAVYTAYNMVKAEIKATGSLPVPKHIRNAPTRLMKELGYGKGYQYAHDRPHALVDQDHLPAQLHGKRYYQPTNRGHEAVIKDRLEKWRQILKRERQKGMPK
ncbi:MAG TPA: replication-associated recombination protein A [Desulfobacterales bacterium]|nr:replication-associated recombination protein A [Desulfobacterales bacterium]